MIAATDRVRLAPGVSLSVDGLVDPLRGGALRLNESARFVAERADGRTIADIAEALAARFGLGFARALADVQSFSGQLNDGLVVNLRPGGGRLGALRRLGSTAGRLAWFGLAPAPVRERRSIHSRTALTAVGSVARALAGKAVLLAAVTAALAETLLATAGKLEPGAPLLVGAAVALGVVVHEAGHAALLRGVPCCLALSGWRVAVLHSPVPPRRRAVVAAAGPGAAFGLGVLLLAASPMLADLALPSVVLAAHGLGVTVAGRDGRTACGLR